MVVAELTIIPMGTLEVRRCIDAAVAVVKASGLRHEVDALGTTVQGELEEVMRVAMEAHQAVLGCGKGRVFTELRLDDRPGETVTIERETRAYRSHPIVRSSR